MTQLRITAEEEQKERELGSVKIIASMESFGEIDYSQPPSVKELWTSY